MLGVSGTVKGDRSSGTCGPPRSHVALNSSQGVRRRTLQSQVNERNGDFSPTTHRTEQGGVLPLPQREVVAMGFHASCPYLVLAGLPRRGHLVNGFEGDRHLIRFGERWVTDPPLVEMDGINLMLSRLNCKRGGVVFREYLWSPRKNKLLSVGCRQLE